MSAKDIPFDCDVRIGSNGYFHALTAEFGGNP